MDAGGTGKALFARLDNKYYKLEKSVFSNFASSEIHSDHFAYFQSPETTGTPHRIQGAGVAVA